MRKEEIVPISKIEEKRPRTDGKVRATRVFILRSALLTLLAPFSVSFPPPIGLGEVLREVRFQDIYPKNDRARPLRRSSRRVVKRHETSRLNCSRTNLDWGPRRSSARCAHGRLGMVMNGPRLAGRLAVVAPYHATDFFHYGKLGPNATSTRRSRLHRPLA